MCVCARGFSSDHFLWLDGWFPDEHEFASFPQYFCVTLFQKRTSENMASFCLGWMPKQLYKNTVGNSQDSSHPGKITNWFHPYLVQQCLFCSPGNSLVCWWCDRSMLASLLLLASDSSFFTPALLKSHSFVFFAVHETRRIFTPVACCFSSQWSEL